MIALISDFFALTQPLCLAGGVPNSTMTTLPALPRAPLWMCEACGAPMWDHVSLKQTFPAEGSSVIFAVPDPSGSPFGVSCLPVILTVMVLLEAPAAGPATISAAATRASDPSRRVRMPRIFPGAPSSKPSDIGRTTLVALPGDLDYLE